ncbi:MAG TPA: hypothetical protein VI299_06695 [Polyangiales bacterium]
MLRTALFTFVFVVSASRALAQQHGVQTEDPPSIFSSGYSGLLAGTAVGAGGGYLVGRRDGWEKSDWRALGLGMGFGALAGAGLGITLGIVDRAGAPGGRYIARDLAAGAGFGAVIGLIGGGISAALNNEAEYALFGTAIGVCAGAGLGIITGIVEGAAKRRRDAARTSRLELQPSLDFARTRDGAWGVALPGIRGVF